MNARAWGTFRRRLPVFRNMKQTSLHNHKGLLWLLCVAFVFMAAPSDAAWQCLDGHPCPPDCAMQKTGGASKPSAAHRECCKPQKSAEANAKGCALCASARPEQANIKEGCTSPVCVLRVKAKPDVASPAPLFFLFDFDYDVAMLFSLAPPPIIDEAAIATFCSLRAPPSRLICRLSTPRAPPILL